MGPVSNSRPRCCQTAEETDVLSLLDETPLSVSTLRHVAAHILKELGHLVYAGDVLDPDLDERIPRHIKSMRYAHEHRTLFGCAYGEPLTEARQYGRLRAIEALEDLRRAAEAEQRADALAAQLRQAGGGGWASR